MKVNTNRGIGLVAAIAILAVVSVGGYAVVKVASNNQANVQVSEEQQQETVAETKADIITGLSEVKATIQSNIDLKTRVQTALNLISDIEARVDLAVSSVEGEARAEIEALRSEISSLKAQIETNADASVEEVENLINEISVSLNSETEFESDSGSIFETDDTGTSTQADSDIEATIDAILDFGSDGETDGSMESDNGMEGDASAEAEVNSETDSGGSNVESTTSVEVQVGY